MIRALRISTMCSPACPLLTGYNISPAGDYTLALTPGPTACGVLLFSSDQSTLLASGAALVGANQPVQLVPTGGAKIGMLDSELGWHVLISSNGTEPPQTVRLSAPVDLQDEIHPVYTDGALGLARATAIIDEHTHYADDIRIMAPLLAQIVPGDMAAASWDGQILNGQAETLGFEATPDGCSDVIILRRIKVISDIPDNLPVSVTPDTADTTADNSVFGNVLDNDSIGLTVTAVNGDSALVGQRVSGSAGGTFVISENGTYSFYPGTVFGDLSSGQTRNTSVAYTATDGTSEASATLTITVSPSAIPVFDRAYYFNNDFTDSLGGPSLINHGLTIHDGYVTGNGYDQWANTVNFGFHQDKFFTICCWAEMLQHFPYYQFIFGSSASDTYNGSNFRWFINFIDNKIGSNGNSLSEKKEVVGQPVFIAAIVNSFQKKIKLYRNAVLMYDGSPPIANAAASEFLQVGGFSSFTPGYARGTKIYSIEIADRELTQEEIQILYARGVM